MAARKRPNNTTPNYIVTMDNDNFEKDPKLFIGKLRSNFMGTEFQIYDNGMNPSDTKNIDDVRSHLGCVKYKTNFFGLNGPRKMKVYLPGLDSDGQAIVYKPLRKDDTLDEKFKEGEKGNIKLYVNKQPKWSDKHQAFVLNFNGRVEKGSVKNFQLVEAEDDEKVILQFGRLNDNLFSCDFTYPLSPFQAFTICLSSLDSKFACEWFANLFNYYRNIKNINNYII